MTENQLTQNWYGLSTLTICKSTKALERYQKSVDKAHQANKLSEREWEQIWFKRIVSYIKNPHAVMLELGAGYGEWCLAFTGVVRNKIVKTNVQDITCYAIEAEPAHNIWCNMHFNKNQVQGKVINAAISNYDGKCKFALMPDPSSWYGQSITVGNGLLRSISNVVRRKNITVNCFTLDTIIKQEEIKHIDFIHMDVQGAECRVIKGGMKTLPIVDYWMIGTHSKQFHRELLELVKHRYEILVNCEPYSVNDNVMCEDGIIVLQRNGL